MHRQHIGIGISAVSSTITQLRSPALLDRGGPPRAHWAGISDLDKSQVRSVYGGDEACGNQARMPEA